MSATLAKAGLASFLPAALRQRESSVAGRWTLARWIRHVRALARPLGSKRAMRALTGRRSRGTLRSPRLGNLWGKLSGMPVDRPVKRDRGLRSPARSAARPQATIPSKRVESSRTWRVIPTTHSPYEDRPGFKISPPEKGGGPEARGAFGTCDSVATGGRSSTKVRPSTEAMVGRDGVRRQQA